MSMLKAGMKYGAIKAKIMAMKGKMLKKDELSSLEKCTEMPELINILRNNRSWSETISSLPSALTSDKLKAAVRGKVPTEIRRIAKFADKRDRDFLLLLACESEYELILSALSRLGSGKGSEGSFAPIDRQVFLLNSKASAYAAAIENSGSWDELTETVSGGIYAKAVRSLEPDRKTGLPDYIKASVLLESTYNKEIFSYAAKKYKGRPGAALRELLGREADWLNIVSLLRLHRYFQSSLKTAAGLLIPISYRLKSELRNEVINARTEAEAVEILRSNGFEIEFCDIENEALESVYEEAISAFCSKFIKLTEPGAATAPAYIILKEIECKRILRIIEAIGSQSGTAQYEYMGGRYVN